MFRSLSALSSLVAGVLLLASACSSGGPPTSTEGQMLGGEGPNGGIGGTVSDAPATSNDGVRASGDGEIQVGGENPVAFDPGGPAGAGSSNGEDGDDDDGDDDDGEVPGVGKPSVVEAFVEDNGLDCAIGELPGAIAATVTLPNPFQKLDGTTVASRADWRCRRKEMRALAERFVFGPKPGKPAVVSGTVTASQVSVNVSDQGNSVTFASTITLPDTGTAPYPAVFALGIVDQSIFLAEGVAIISVNQAAIAQEQASGGSTANRQNKLGAFYTLYGSASPSGLLAAWAWGVSRYIDVIEAADGSIIRKDAFAVMGCSRNGRAALAAGALDERISLSVPAESGSAGVALFRGVAQAEVGDNGQPSLSLSATYGEQAWLGDAFGAFVNSPNTLPIDTHQIIGMFAPRGLLVLDNPFLGELAPRAAHAAALAGLEVYEALGAEESFSYHSNTANGSHCSIRSEYREPLRQAIVRHLFENVGAAAGAIHTNLASATANPQDWINWQTPALD